MAKDFLDLKKFKHVKSDDKSTTLQHKDGHVLTVAHKSLSKDFQKQLAALSQVSKQDETAVQNQEEQAEHKAYGGDVGYLGSRVPFKSADPAKPAPSPEYRDKTSSEQDKQRHAEQDASDANYRKAHPAPAESKEDDSGYKSYAKGGSVRKMYAEGSEDVEADPNQVMTPNPNYQQPFEAMQPDQAAAAPVNPYAEMYGKVMQHNKMYNPGLPDSMARQDALNYAENQKNADQSNAKIVVEDAQAQQQKILQENQRRQSIGLEPLPVPSIPPLPGANQPVQMPQSNATTQPIDQAKQGVEDAQRGLASPSAQGVGGGGSRAPEDMLESGYQQQVQGLQQQAKAVGDLGQQQAATLDQGLIAQHQAQKSFQDSYQQLENERQSHIQDIKDGYIDPNAYWKDHSKVMSGIGMILAGFNPTNSPNAAINFLKYQMDQSMEAQRQNLNSKNNLLSANLHQFGNLRDAMDMTRVMQNDIMSHELQSAAAKAQTPMAKASALQAAGKLQMESAPLFQQFALRRAMMNLSTNGGSPQSIDHMLGYMRVVNPEMAKEMESRYIPGVGLASVPISETARKEMSDKQKLNDAGHDLLKYSQTHTNLVPGTPEYNYGVAKSMSFQQQVREGLLGTVFRESEKPLLEKFVNENPAGALKMINTQPKIKAILESNQLGLNTLKKSYGLPQQQTQTEPQYKTVNGVKYMRGPNGQAIRVK